MVHEKKRCSRARWKMKRNIFELTNEKKTEKLFRFVLFVFVQHHAKLRRAHIERRIYTWCLKHRKSIENNNNHTTEIKKKENCFSVFFLRRFLLLISTCLHITKQRWKKNFSFVWRLNAIFLCVPYTKRKNITTFDCCCRYCCMLLVATHTRNFVPLRILHTASYYDEDILLRKQSRQTFFLIVL